MMKTPLTVEEPICLQSLETGGTETRQASRPLALARPWWERFPEHFQLLADELAGIIACFGHALGPADERGGNHPVPTVIARTNVKTHSLADVLYFQLIGHAMSLRFQLQSFDEPPEPQFEVTFVAADTADPLFIAHATLSPGGEYRLKVDVPSNLAKAWAHLRVTDRMPFRFILRAETLS